MQDSILNETGNSRFLRTEASALQKYPTYQAFMQALMAGEVLIDLNGINPDGFAQVGTPLNKSNLLTDATAAQAGLGSEATPNDMFAAVAQKANSAQEAASAASSAASAVSQKLDNLITKSTVDLTAGSSTLATDRIYLVYE